MLRFVLIIPKLYLYMYMYFSSSRRKFSYHCYYKWYKLRSINFTVLHVCLNLSIVNIMKWGLFKSTLLDICCKITFWNKLLSVGMNMTDLYFLSYMVKDSGS